MKTLSEIKSYLPFIGSKTEFTGKYSVVCIRVKTDPCINRYEAVPQAGYKREVFIFLNYFYCIFLKNPAFYEPLSCYGISIDIITQLNIYVLEYE